jgi:hypothetical protein
MIWMNYGYVEYFALAFSLDGYCFGMEYHKWKDYIHKEGWHIEHINFKLSRFLFHSA